MSHYKSNLRDIEFNLFEVLGRDDVLGSGPFAEVDVDTAREVLAEVDRLAREDLAASYEDSDRNPPVFDPATNDAPLPESFKKCYRPAWTPSSGACRSAEELGGTAGALEPSAGRSPRWCSAPTRRSGCTPPAPPSPTSCTATATTATSGSPSIIVEREWGSTMVLTEPDAGSDVGAGRTKAIPQDDGSWHIEGVKRFITSGEHDLCDNIIHLVLARPVGVEGVGGPGTKGLSLFIVPKFHFDHETGELRRAQRRLRHQRRAQDGPQGLQHLRAHLRRPATGRRAGQGLAARRDARRHRADVPDHRVRPDDGRHQGDRHPLHRLPQRAGVRQEPGPGRRPDPGRRQDRAAGHRSPTTRTCAAR